MRVFAPTFRKRAPMAAKPFQPRRFCTPPSSPTLLPSREKGEDYFSSDSDLAFIFWIRPLAEPVADEKSDRCAVSWLMAP